MNHYFHHSFQLEEEPRIIRLQQVMWLEGIGIFWTIYRQLRLCNGRYPLEALLLLAKGNRSRKRKILQVITDFDLFYIENGIVQLQGGLSPATSTPRQQDDSPQARAEEARKRLKKGYKDNIFPKECKSMDEDALKESEQQIRKQNESEVEKQCNS